MSAGYPALTDKEKQTLRLLLGGHDAKSIARLLGLSVHTIHERLRDARRKLGTSSSREAARMLREMEHGHPAPLATPDSLVDKAFGGAACAEPAEALRQPVQGRGEWRRAGWIVGALAMIISLAVFALSALAGPERAAPAPAAPAAPAVPASPADPADPADPAAPAAPVAPPPPVARTAAAEAAAVTAAQRFLALVDRDDWRGSWQAAHRSFQLHNTVEWWAQASRQVRGRVGTPQSRKLLRTEFIAAPPRGYWIVSFSARYSHRGEAVETLQLAPGEGVWKVAGITVD